MLAHHASVCPAESAFQRGVHRCDEYQVSGHAYGGRVTTAESEAALHAQPDYLPGA